MLGKRMLGKCSLMLSPFAADPRVTELSSLQTDGCHRQTGQANRLLNKICEEADECGRVLVLVADDVDWIRAWYESHGFGAIQREPIYLMARKPVITETMKGNSNATSNP